MNIDKQQHSLQPQAYRSNRPASREHSNRQYTRTAMVVAVLLAMGLIIVVRLVWMQVFTWSTVIQAAPPEVNPPVPRVDTTTGHGTIVDRNGELLAADHTVYRITASPRHTSPEDWQEIAHVLESVAGIPAAITLATLHDNADESNAVLAREIPLAQGHALLEVQRARREQDDYLLVYIYATAVPRRFYPQHRLASHVLGFVNVERVSHYGVESYYDRFLREDGAGLPPGRWQGRDALADKVWRYIPRTEGKALVLTLDRTVQWIIERRLQEALDTYRAEAGTIIVMDPKTGAILGLANLPTYDPNQYSLFYREDPKALIDTAISAQYEPGSVYKLITYAAALDQEIIEPTTIFTDTGMIAVGDRLILNSSRTSAGLVTAADALALSLNVVAAQIAAQVGTQEFYRYVQRFGFGQTTDVDLAGEVAGQVKTPGSPYWSPSDLATNSFGQGLAVTPIQLVTAVSAIANGGLLMRPYIVQARVQDDRVLLTQPTAVRQSLRPETAATMTEMMVHTIETGNTLATVPGFKAAGKSGTAQIPTLEGYTERETIVSFAGFVPADDPQFVILVKMDRPDPDISPWANYTAAPVFGQVAFDLLNQLNIPPDEQRLARSQP